MGLARAMLRAWLHPPDYGEAMQAALGEQRRLDMFDIQCQSCGGLGVVADMSNRWYEDDEMVYGGKRCLECDGLGSPRA